MRIGLVSDTHGRFDLFLPRILAGCDRIVHAGDVVGREVLRQLEELAPVVAVRGNNNRGADGVGLRDVESLQLEGLKAVVVHELGRPERLTAAARAAVERESPDVVIFGHSHRPLAQAVAGRVFVNPGSAGPRRFSLPRSAGIAIVHDRKIRVELINLEGSSPRLLAEPFEASL